MDRVIEISKIMQSQDVWDEELLKELCDIAGIAPEWQDSTEDNFEAVAYKAADILNIDIDYHSEV